VASWLGFSARSFGHVHSIKAKLKVCATILTSVCILYECFCLLFVARSAFFAVTFECLMQIDLPSPVWLFFFFVSAMPTFAQANFPNGFKLQLSPLGEKSAQVVN